MGDINTSLDIKKDAEGNLLEFSYKLENGVFVDMELLGAIAGVDADVLSAKNEVSMKRLELAQSQL